MWQISLFKTYFGVAEGGVYFVLFCAILGSSAYLVSFISLHHTIQVHFYDFTKPNLPVHMASDVDDMFVPLPFNSCCWVKAGDKLDACLQFADRLPHMAATINEDGSALGAAMIAGELVLSDSGGRIMATYSKVPTLGVGVFKPKEDTQLRGNKDKEKELWNPTPGWWPDFGVRCAKASIGVDFFAFPMQPCELATIGSVAAITGGQVYLYAHFMPQRDADRLLHQMTHNVTREAGYAGMMIVRCSRGIRVKSYSGHFYQTDTQVVDIAAIDSDKTYGVELEHEGKINPAQVEHSYLQTALLYTTRSGRRRIRVHTLRLQVASTIPFAFKHADLGTTVALLARRATNVAQTKGLAAAWTSLHNSCVDILAAYRQHVAKSSPSAQLVLPEAMKLLPIFCLAIGKSPGFRPLTGGNDSIDERVFQLHNLHAMRMCDIQPYCYPKLLPLHSMQPNCGEYDEQNGIFILPAPIELASEKVSSSGIFLLHDYTTDRLYIWVGERASPHLQSALFGEEYVTAAAGHNFSHFIREKCEPNSVRSRVCVCVWTKG